MYIFLLCYNYKYNMINYRQMNFYIKKDICSVVFIYKVAAQIDNCVHVNINMTFIASFMRNNGSSG